MNSQVNPFELVTASKLNAQEAVKLWCDDKRLDKVQGQENCFINGHRGTGKSMLFRILRHDCQILLNPSSPPSFLSIYFSVKDSDLLTEEFTFFQDDKQKFLISESHLSLLILKQLFWELKEFPSIIDEDNKISFRNCFVDCFKSAFQYTQESIPNLILDDFSDFIAACIRAIDSERNRIVNYIGLRLYENAPFNGPLFLFDTLLGPIADYFSKNQDKCLYFLIDDGDDLPISHTIALNSWIARRRKSAVFKVSTMFGYKTYETRTRSAIQNPHDFFLFEIATRYVSDTGEDYVELLRKITEKRLEIAGVKDSEGGIDPFKFFPEDSQQLERMKKVEENLKGRYKKLYKGRKVNDQVYRHRSSEYIKMLANIRSPYSYTYSGFKTLATLSSGLVRDFIMSAQHMYDKQARKIKIVNEISPSIQNEVVKNYADQILEEISDTKEKRSNASNPAEDWKKVRNIIEGIGILFKNKMLSEDHERRVFSFSIQGEAPLEITRLLDLAISEGYLMKGYISKKEGTGRRTLYVLTRRLAPVFNLDVSAYAGYLSLIPEKLQELANYGASREYSLTDIQQLPLIDKWDDDMEPWAIMSPEEVNL